MIGGGPGSFIGAVHRIAARMDGYYELVAGAFSSKPEKCLETARELGIAQERAYPSWAAMLEGELALPADERVQVVMITTPNHVHAAPTIAALESGFHVVLDKPLCTSMEEALAMEAAAKGSKRLFCLTHTYTGYPMIKEAKHQIASGALGTVRKIYVEYPQGWLSTFLEGGDHTQAAWLTDPKKSGKVGAMGDIGTHAFNLAEYVSGEEIVEVCAQLNTVVNGRALDDDGAVLFRTASGATGVLMATQIAAGEENNVKIRVFGEKRRSLLGARGQQQLNAYATGRTCGETAHWWARDIRLVPRKPPRTPRPPGRLPRGICQLIQELRSAHSGAGSG